MNGTIFDEVKKNTQNKKKEKVKFIAALLFSNIFVAISILQFSKNEKPILIEKIPTSKIIHKDFKMLIIPLNAMIELNEKLAEIPVSLINEQKKIIIKKAYLHGKINSKNEGEYLSKSSQFKIEIKQSDLSKLASEYSENLIAIPEITEEKIKTITTTKRNSKYEISI